MKYSKVRLKQALVELKKMVPPFEGGCLCDSFRYRCTATPIWSCNCHCRSCQKLSGSPFVSAFTVSISAFDILSGETVTIERQADSGNTVTTHHCKLCGTRLFAERTANANMTSIFASTLDDPTTFTPISNVYASEVAPWTDLDEALLSFEKMPEDEL